MLTALAGSVTVEQKTVFTQAVANVMVPSVSSTLTGGSIVSDSVVSAKQEKVVTSVMGALEAFSLTALTTLGSTGDYTEPLTTRTPDGRLQTQTGFMTGSAGTFPMRVGAYRFDVPTQWLATGAAYNSVNHLVSPYTWTDRSFSTDEGVASLSLFDGKDEAPIADREECVGITRDSNTTAKARRESLGSQMYVVSQDAPLLLEFTRVQADMLKTMHIIVEPFAARDAFGVAQLELEALLGTGNALHTTSSGGDFDFAFTPVSVRDASMAAKSDSVIADRSHVLQVVPRHLSTSVCRDTQAVAHAADSPSGDTTYRLVVRPKAMPGNHSNHSSYGSHNSSNVTVTVSIMHLECLYLDEPTNTWRDDNCTVDPMSEPGQLKCHCNHLTVFGGAQGSSTFVKPNLVKIRAITAADIGNNAVVFVPIVFLWILFVLCMRSACTADDKALLATGPISLPDNRDSHVGHYQITVNTGFRYNAGLPHDTRVFIQLAGTNGMTSEFELGHEWRPLFQRGASDVFLVTTPDYIGNISHVTIRHDGHGDLPQWFLNGLEVANLKLGRRGVRYFWLGKWVAFDIGDSMLEYEIPGLTLKQSATWNRAFETRITRSVTDSHTVIAAFLAPPGAKFNRSQRTMTLMAFFCGSLFANAFFFQTDGEKLNVAQTITTGIISSLLVLIPVTVIIFLFRRARPARRRRDRVAASDDTGANGSGNAVKETSLADQGSTSTSTLISAKKPSGALSALMRSSVGTVSMALPTTTTTTGGVFSTDDEAEMHGNTRTEATYFHTIRKMELPYWCRHLAWALSLGMCVWSCYYVLLLSFEWGPIASWTWLAAVVSSVFMLTAVTDPVFILLVAAAGTVVFGFRGSKDKLFRSGAKEIVHCSEKDVARLRKYREKSSAKSTTKLPASYMEKRKGQLLRDQQMSTILWNIVRYLIFYGCVIVAFMASQEEKSFGLIGFIVDAVALGEGDMIWRGNSVHDYDTEFGDIGNQDDFWAWAEASVGNMHKLNWYNGDAVQAQAHSNAAAAARIANEQVYFLGAPRLRQLRVSPNTCTIAAAFGDRVHDCLGAWSPDTNDEDVFYGHNYTGGPSAKAWQYGTEAATNFWGDYHNTQYSRAGYSQTLPANNFTAAAATLSQMKALRWLDERTRFAVLELTVYSPVTDRVVTAALGVEFTPSGGVSTSVRTTSHAVYRYRHEDAWFTIMCELLLFILAVYQLYALGQGLRQDTKETKSFYAGVTKFATALRMYVILIC